MPLLERETFIAASRDRVFEFFADPKNLARITPPSLGFAIVDAPSRSLRAGDRIRYSIRVAGMRLPWVSHISEWTDGVSFTDEQERGPYRTWVHRHLLRDAGGGTLMIDRVDYTLPLGFIGDFFGGWFVRRNLRQIFDYRAKVIEEIFGKSFRV